MPSYENALEASGGLVRRVTTDRQNLMRHETEDFLRAESEACKERQEEFWHRITLTRGAGCLRRAERRRWLDARRLRASHRRAADRAGAVLRGRPRRGRWITVPLYGNLRGRGVLALPKNASGRLPS